MAAELIEEIKPFVDVELEIIVNLIVQIHNSIVEFNKKLRARAQKFNYITPRDFIDFITHFVDLIKKKKNKLNEQQAHLQQGLKTIDVTEKTVQLLKVTLDENDKKLIL